MKDNKFTLNIENGYTWEGKEYKEIIFDFGKLTGQDMIDIEKEMNDAGEFALTAETSPNMCARIAARAAGLSLDVITHLPLGHFNKARNAARNFIMAAN